MRGIYLNHWRLSRRPFDERVDADWFFPSAHHDGLLTQLRCFVHSHDPICVVAGGSGFGKTMVAQALVELLSPTVYRSVVAGIAGNSCSAVLREVAEELPCEESERLIDSPRVCDLPDDELAGYLLRQTEPDSRRARYTIVIVEVADRLPQGELFRLVRTVQLLAADGARVSCVLLGSPELLTRARGLDRAGAKPFPRCVLGAMAPADTVGYLAHRLRLAGGDQSLFTPGALDRMNDLSAGVPRRINRLADLGLLIAFSRGRDAVGEDELWAAQGELELLAPTRTGTIAPNRRWRTLARRTAPDPLSARM